MNTVVVALATASSCEPHQVWTFFVLWLLSILARLGTRLVTTCPTGTKKVASISFSMVARVFLKRFFVPTV